MSEGAKPRKWATTAEVAAAAEMSGWGAMTWSRRGVLPAYETVYGGKHGRQARWPLHAPAQAAWVRAQLEAGHTFDEIKGMLDRGEWRPEDDRADGEPSKGGPGG